MGFTQSSSIILLPTGLPYLCVRALCVSVCACLCARVCLLFAVNECMNVQSIAIFIHSHVHFSAFSWKEQQ